MMQSSCTHFIFVNFLFHMICRLYHIYYIAFVLLMVQSSEGSRNTIRDKAAELETMKAQLARIKALMEDSTKIRDSIDSSSEPEQDIDAHDENATNGIAEDMTNVPFERSNDANHAKLRCFDSNFSDIRVSLIIILF